MRNNPYGYFIFAIVVLLIDLYSYQAVKTFTRDMGPGWRQTLRIGFWSITALTLFFFYFTNYLNPFKSQVPLHSYIRGTIMLIYIGKLFVVIFLLIDDIVRLFRLIASYIFPPKEAAVAGAHNIPRLKFISQLGLGIASFFFMSGIYGMAVSAYDYKLRRIKLKIPNLPDGFNGYKMVQISDIHSGSFTRTNPLKNAVDTINKENADLIFFTGDLVNNRATEIEPYLDIFSKLKAKEKVYSILGNHDYGDYDPEFRKDPQAKLANMKTLQAHHKALGWDLLLDEHRIHHRGNDKIAIIGVQNCAGKNFHTYGDLDKAYKGTEAIPFKILLSHDPSYWDYRINKDFKDIDLTLSGHTHGAQFGVEIPGWRWSPSQYVYKQWAGLYQEGKQYIYVNRGFGFIGYPGRMGILPEITVIELYKG